MSAGNRILSLDAGGLHTLVSLRMIKRIERERPFLHNIDVFSGASAGGISALILARGGSPSENLDVAIEFWEDTRYFTINPSYAVAPLLSASYTPSPAREALEEVLGDLHTRDLSHKIVVPALCLDNEGHNGSHRQSVPHIFSNMRTDCGGSQAVHGGSLVEIALATSAAPLGYPIHEGFIDGGTFASNPALCAAAAVVSHSQALPGLPSLLSVGGGAYREFVESKDGDWGIGQWLLNPSKMGLLLRLMESSLSQVVSWQCKHLMGSNYHRLNPCFPEPVPSADAWLPCTDLNLLPRVIERLGDMAEAADIEPTLRWIDEHWAENSTQPMSSSDAMSSDPSIAATSPSANESTPEVHAP